MSRPSWVFVTPTLHRPTGGDIALFELISALARLGAGRVRLVHVPFGDERTRGLADLPWVAFDPGVEHTFATTLDPEAIPRGDVLVYTMKLVASARHPSRGEDGARLLEVLSAPSDHRLPLTMLFLQGLGVFGDDVEDLALRLPGPKVCVSSWLVDRAVQAGVDPDDVVHIPNGVDPATFAVLRAVHRRDPCAALNYDPHPVKRGDEGLDALGRLHHALEVPGLAFGTRAPSAPLPAGVRFVASPSRLELVRDIYNASSVFLQPSRQEGFGMCAVEAMACGCALVTTDNGGSADFAFHEETALVCGPDPAEMAEALGRLVRDDPLRVRLATAGAAFVERFRWTASAERLQRFVEPRLGAPQ